jgi:putative acyl-CoA dehydrogenase
MQNVVADLVLESEAAMALALRLARAFDQHDEASLLLRRVLTPAAKFWVCKRGAAVAAEAMEVLGGNGYVEEAPLARLYRQMPLNSIWEGAGNVMCLDVLRALVREPRCIDVVFAEIAAARSGNTDLDRFADLLHATLRSSAGDEAAARVLAQRIALAVQAALLVRFAPPFVADAFCASRLAPAAFAGGVFGTLAPAIARRDIMRRAWEE